jgi:hypothetical protein
MRATECGGEGGGEGGRRGQKPADVHSRKWMSHDERWGTCADTILSVGGRLVYLTLVLKLRLASIGCRVEHANCASAHRPWGRNQNRCTVVLTSAGGGRQPWEGSGVIKMERASQCMSRRERKKKPTHDTAKRSDGEGEQYSHTGAVPISHLLSIDM